MKKHLLSATVGLALSAVTFTSSADDLAQIYQLAVQNDPALLRAAAERDAAQKQVDIAESAFWPQLTGQAGYTESTRESYNFDDSSQSYYLADSNTDGWDASITLNQSIFDWSTWKQADIAEKQAYQAEVAYRDAAQSLMLRVVNAYFGALQAQDDLAFAEAEKRAIERQLEQTKQRFSVGLTAITDVHEAQAQYDSAVAAEIQAQNAVDIAFENIREITGQYPNQLAGLQTQSFDPSKPTPEDVRQWVTKAENNNLSLMQSMVAVDIAEQRIKVEQSGHYPTVGLQASYSTGDSETEAEIPGFGTRTSNPPRLDNKSIGISVNVPIFSGYRTTALTEQARDNYVATSQTMVETRRTVERETRNAFYDVTASLSSIRAFEQAVTSAESALKATEAGFEVGTRTIVDVLNSTRNLFNARRNLAEARYGYIRQRLALEQAVGDLTPEDLQGINAALSEQADGTAAD
ncbi:outer membrane channel protein TolC [Idiomarina aquatica]|uniref:Outer membrane channel protein TolC n=1 Tax=Idiomarina aquatica TaxID=1327752 RepID=A0AA94JCH4_9GAMM|nr:outer membrane channel protein TolC [Idiomarina aquatica]RUO39690.1 outer membrane channel protein TolC [Idiomarina aquatica]